MSASVRLGETAQFVCAGEAIVILWTINGRVQALPETTEHGVDILYDDTNSPVLKTTLIVPGKIENDNAAVQCILTLHNSNVLVYSSVALLTVHGKLCIVNK